MRCWPRCPGGWWVRRRRSGRRCSPAGQASTGTRTALWDFAARRVDPSWAVPELRPGLRLESALSHEAADLTSLWMSAYPPGHPDNPDGETFDSARTQLALLFDGQVLGPLLACSTVIVDGTRPVAASLVSGRDGEPPLGGPWITEVFRHAGPEYVGLGAVALRASLALAADGGCPRSGWR
ncbi:hypothetical protein ACU686_44950 [Yinghuangia aomiensis]